jgi:N-acyl-D-amino-acid deacylase
MQTGPDRIHTVIRGGTVVDGTGAPGRLADVAIAADRIVAVGGRIDAPGADIIDASGALVTPGWVDIHTHYDGQVTWDDTLDPSFRNGVTTVVMGNCGVGFAPCRRGDERTLVEVMEGVEDIPGTALSEGVPWGQWESFAEYLDFLAGRAFTMDVATQVPHSALRLAVMGQRALEHADASADDIAAMRALVTEAVGAGALGFSTSRTIFHRSIDGRAIPGTYASAHELHEIALGVARAGGAVLEAISSSSIGDMEFLGGERFTAAQEMELLAALSRASGLAVTFTTVQTPDHPDDWRDVLEHASRENARGARLRPQVASRPIGLLNGLSGHHGLCLRPTYVRELAGLPLAERARRMQDPAIRRRILEEADELPEESGSMTALAAAFFAAAGSMYAMREGYDYEPGAEDTIAARAESDGIDVAEAYYDALAEDGGRNYLSLMGTNYVDGNLDVVREMLLHPHTVTGLADAGAHVNLISDGSMPTTQLSHWGRNRRSGGTLPVEFLVEKQTRRNARLYGLADRGTVEPGMRADLNVIDLDRLGVGIPEPFADLPAGGVRLLQRVTGYVATVAGGTVTARDGVDTGARPGRLVRGSRCVGSQG